MPIFMRKREPRLDLMGRQPRANRAIIIVSLVLLLVSLVVIAGILSWQHSRYGASFSKIFGPALHLEARLYSVPQEIDLLNYAQGIDSVLALTRDSLGALWTEDDECLSEPFGELTHRGPNQPIPLTCRDPRVVSNDSILMAVHDSAALKGLKGVKVVRGRDTAVFFPVVQYQKSDWLDSLKFRSGATFPGDSLRRRFQVVGQALRSVYERLNDKALLTDTTSNKGGKNDSSSVGRITHVIDTSGTVAFVYCALALDTSVLDTASLAGLVQDRISRLMEERYDASLPEGEKSYNTLPTIKQDSLKKLYLMKSDTIPYYFLCYPATYLMRSYDCSQRTWLRDAAEDGSVAWSASYPDAGTGMPVITASVSVRNRPGGSLLGILGADLFTNRFARLPTFGNGYLANYLIVFIMTVLLIATVATSSRMRFDFLIFMFMTLVCYYVAKIITWSLGLEHGIWGQLVMYLDLILSSIVSFSFFGAAYNVYHEFKYKPFDTYSPEREEEKEKRRKKASKGEPSTLKKFVELLPGEPSQFSAILASAFLLAFFTAGFDILFRPFLKQATASFLQSVDSVVSFLAVFVLGHYFCRWLRVFFRTWLVIVAYVTFGLYAIVQLPHAMYSDEPIYWTWLAATKTSALLLVVGATYLWVQLNNFERIRGTGSRALMLERLGTPRHSIILAGVIDTRQVIFVDWSTLVALGHASDDQPGTYHWPNGEVVGWEPSDFGYDLYRPKWDAIDLSEVFYPGDFEGIASVLARENPETKVRKNLEDHVTTRITVIKVLRSLGTFALQKKVHGQRFPITIVSLTAWQDKDSPIEPQTMIAQPDYVSPWYFIMYAEVPGGNSTTQDTGRGGDPGPSDPARV